MTSVKPRLCLSMFRPARWRLCLRPLDDWWIELALVGFIIGTMVYNHFN